MPCPVLASYVLSSWTFTFQVALPLLRHYSMVFSSCRRRSTDARIFTIGGPNEDISSCFSVVLLHLWNNKSNCFICALVQCPEKGDMLSRFLLYINHPRKIFCGITPIINELDLLLYAVASVPVKII